MLMSKSRLEKFLYALYSLDSSDLPKPLSRIEELYKCWVTGEEAPSFEPISRVEKYLMAILGVYDVDSLPNPLSRVEALLYKLATGDDNLDDVETFLSEHEELLAEIIRNGGAGGNIDIEYILYTLSTEFNTLYNTAKKPVKSAILKGNTLVNLVKTSVYGGIQNGTCVEGDYLYKVIESIVNAGASILTRFQTIYPLSPSTVYYLKLTDVAHTNAFLVREHDNGKNLITEIHDLENKIIKFTTSELGTSDLLFYQQKLQVGAKVKYSENFIISDDVDSLYNVNDYFTGMQSVKMPVLTTSNEDGTKTNILTVNEDVELRGVGDVQDTLDLMTGELTQRIGEAVLDGSEVWGLATTKEKTQVFELGLNNQKVNNANRNSLIMCDKIKVASGVDKEIIVLTSSFYLALLKTKASTVAELTVYLSQNPITIQYQIKKESIKTVDLSTVNQDGNNTKLSTFIDITHVTLSSEGLIPEAELEVATKNEEVLNTLSLEMDDISTTQNTLEETSNVQSENVDSTMIATTEIYEELL